MQPTEELVQTTQIGHDVPPFELGRAGRGSQLEQFSGLEQNASGRAPLYSASGGGTSDIVPYPAFCLRRRTSLRCESCSRELANAVSRAHGLPQLGQFSRVGRIVQMGRNRDSLRCSEEAIAGLGLCNDT